MFIINAAKHLKLILIHKWWVFYYCCKVGILFRGFVHDLSKFSPTEFIESVRYYDGTKSPIDVCKERNGYSKAWLHHKGRNTHHYEYWQDEFDKGTVHIRMPFKDTLEMFCDYLGAGRAYMKKDFSYSKEYEWWTKKRELATSMDSETKKFMEIALWFCANANHLPTYLWLKELYYNINSIIDYSADGVSANVL